MYMSLAEYEKMVDDQHYFELVEDRIFSQNIKPLTDRLLSHRGWLKNGLSEDVVAVYAIACAVVAGDLGKATEALRGAAREVADDLLRDEINDWWDRLTYGKSRGGWRDDMPSPPDADSIGLSEFGEE